MIQHGASTYEERVVVVRAPDRDSAFAQAESEALEYCGFLTDCRQLSFFQLYEISEDDEDEGSAVREVFSLMPTSELEPDLYLDRYFDTGEELEEK